jgi:hypothetical protein
MIDGGSRIKDFTKGSAVYLQQLRKSTIFSSEGDKMQFFFYFYVLLFVVLFMYTNENISVVL